MAGNEIRFSAPDVGDAEVEAATRALLSGWITTGEEMPGTRGGAVGVPGRRARRRRVIVHRGARDRRSAPGAPARIPYRRADLDVRVDRPGAASTVGSAPSRSTSTPGTFNLSADALEAAIDGPEGLDAVIGVHFAGTPLEPRDPPDLRRRRTCRSSRMQRMRSAHPTTAGMIAGQGTAGACFSFYATKNLTSAEGGALATDDRELAEFAQSFRLHGLSRDAWARYTPGARTGSYDIARRRTQGEPARRARCDRPGPARPIRSPPGPAGRDDHAVPRAARRRSTTCVSFRRNGVPAAPTT